MNTYIKSIYRPKPLWNPTLSDEDSTNEYLIGFISVCYLQSDNKWNKYFPEHTGYFHRINTSVCFSNISVDLLQLLAVADNLMLYTHTF